jgi:hypothetical protein
MSIKETQGRQKRKHRVPKVVECLNFMYSFRVLPTDITKMGISDLHSKVNNQEW